MPAATVDDVEAALDLIRAAYPGYNPTVNEATAGVWHYGLARFTGPVVIAAATWWGQNEERFPTLPEFIAAASATERRMAASEEQAGARGGDKCAECGDGNGMVMLNPAGQGTVRPCRTCSPAAFDRWRGGHWGRDHDCQVCRDVRRSPSRK